MGGIRRIGKSKIVAATITMVSVLAVAVTGVVLTARTNLPSLNLELPPDYQPGHILSLDLPRYREYYRSYTSLSDYVIPAAPDQEYIIEIDMPVRTVQHVSKWIRESGITLGDLILRWGTPIGTHGSFVVWPNRGAFVVTRAGFSPNDAVYFLTYGGDQKSLDAWTGFSREKSETSGVSLQQLVSLLPGSP